MVAEDDAVKQKRDSTAVKRAVKQQRRPAECSKQVAAKVDCKAAVKQESSKAVESVPPGCRTKTKKKFLVCLSFVVQQ